MFGAEFVLAVIAVYLGIGLVFASAFVLWGVGQIDTEAKDTSPGFRLLILPGAAAFWPLLAVRWRQALSRREAQ